MDREAKEHVIQFGIEDWWINDLYSYLTNTPSKQYVQAIEDSIVLQIHKEKLNELYNTVPANRTIF